MSKTRRTLTMDSDISRALSQICVRHGDATWHVEQALAAYKPIKTLLKVVGTEVVPAKPKTNRFVKPEFGELVELFWQSGQFTNYDEAKDKATDFINHYDSNGWKVGKNQMKNWKATVSQWIARRKKDGQANGYQSGNKQPAKQSLAQRSADSSGRMDTYIAGLRENEKALGATGSLISSQMDI